MSETHQRTVRAMLTGVPGLLALKNKALKYEVVNPRFCQFLALSPEEIVGKTDADLFPADQAGLSAKEDQAVLGSGMPRKLEQPLAGKDGLHWFDVNRTAILDDDGDPAGILFTGYDITGFKQREGAIQQAEGKVTEAQQQAQTAQAAADAAAEKLATLEAQATAAEQEKAGAEAARQELNARITELESQLTTAQAGEAAAKKMAEAAETTRAEAAALARQLAEKLG